MKINNLQLPNSLLKIITSPTNPILNHEKWQKCFPDEIHDKRLYNLSQIKKNTNSLRDDFYRQVLVPNLNLAKNEQTLIEGPLMDENFLFGRLKEGVYPGILDARNTLVIGDIGIDMIFCLNYHSIQDESPSVVYLTHDLLWIEIAKNFEEFAYKTGLLSLC